jgi:hypothetical protein
MTQATINHEKMKMSISMQLSVACCKGFLRRLRVLVRAAMCFCQTIQNFILYLPHAL